ncbi:hypothetical protein HYT18_02135 [Candidatus Microgenomates bacterium]|nr:hypothetical protein [Candidatus Microgenomates bacterium]
MLKTFRKKHKYLYYLLLGIALVLFWRGFWGLMDLYLFPQNQFLSYLLSIAGALMVLFFTHSWTNLKE